MFSCPPEIIHVYQLYPIFFTWLVFRLATSPCEVGIGRLFSAAVIFSPALSAEIETFKHEDF